MANKSVIERLDPIFRTVEEQLTDHLASDVPFVRQVCEYILMSGGKRLRPALFVLAARLSGHEANHEYYYSSIFEYLHAATLLHDDVVDEADMRRGHKAAHLVYGTQGVILVGDFLFAKALVIASETGEVIFTDVLSKTVASMAEGEVLQLLHAHDAEITEAEYERVIHRKTGALIEAACYLGAVLAKAPQDHAERLREYGRKIGLAFQMIDDALDYSTTAEEFGKPVGHDLDEGKITLPIIRTLAQADEDDRAEFRELVVKKTRTAEEFARVGELIRKYRGIEQTLDRAAELIGEAKEALSVFPDRDEKTDLMDLAEFIITRRR